MASLFPPGTLIVGCEISLRRARRIQAHGFRIVVGQGEALPFRGGAFDLVTLIEVIEHTQSPARVLDEVGRGLRTGGRLAPTTPNYPLKRPFDPPSPTRPRGLGRLRHDATHISPLPAGR